MSQISVPSATEGAVPRASPAMARTRSTEQVSSSTRALADLVEDLGQQPVGAVELALAQVVLGQPGEAARLATDPTAARHVLDQAQRELMAVDHPRGLVTLRCARAEVEHRAGQSAAAQAALQEAQALHGRMDGPATSRSGRRLARVAAQLARPERWATDP